MIDQQSLQTSRRRHQGHRDGGAAAVEMALVLPVLLFILMGLIDFGRAYNAEIQITQAAREGVRLASLNATANTADPNYGNVAIKTRVHAAAGGVPDFTAVSSAANAASCPTTADSVCVVYCPASASASAQATVVVTSKFTWITGISSMSKLFGSGTFPTPTSVTSTGVMRCAG